jgi:peroxiredoxin
MHRSLSLLAALCLVPLVACENPDPDEDGLSTEFERAFGTNPEVADTDNDGFDDALEILTYFSPRDADDFPYEGGFSRGPLMRKAEWDDYTEDDGWGVDDITRNWTLTDQHGGEIQLKRFYGNVILIDLSSEWCGPCRMTAETLDEEYLDRKDDGFVVIQLLLDGLTMGDRAPQGDRWIDEFGITFPLLEDGDFEAAERYLPAGSYAIPNYTLIDRQHRIHTWYKSGGEPPWDDIDALLAEDRPEVDYSLPDNAEELYELHGLDPNSWTN